MIKQWIDFFLDIPGDFIEFLNGFTLWGSISLLQIIVVAAVAGILTGTFLSVARR